MKKKVYETIEECNLEDDRLTRNIAIAVTPRMHQQWRDLKEFFRYHEVNIAENVRQAICNEFEALEQIKMKHEEELVIRPKF